MLINISKFLASDENSYNFEGEILSNESNYDLNYLNLIFPIKYGGSIYNLKNELMLDLNISYKFITNCDRCLKEMEGFNEFNYKAYHYMDDSLYDENATDEYFELYDNKIDIDDIVLSSVITSMPSKNLCSNDCKGLCPVCGNDLNEKTCDCHETKEYKLKEIDPRFEKLLDLFNDEEV